MFDENKVFNNRVPNEEMQEFIRRIAYPLRRQGFTYSQIAERLSKNFPLFTESELIRRVKYQLNDKRNLYKEYLASCDDYEPNVANATTENNETYAINKDGSRDSVKQIAASVDEVKKMTPDAILKLHGFNPDEWDLVSLRHSAYQMASADGPIDMTSSKISATPKKTTVSNQIDVMRQQLSLIDERRKYDKPIPVKYNKAGEGCVVIPLADFHLDKREGKSINSFENQIERFYKLINKYCSFIETHKKDVSKIIFFWSQDFFNYDNLSESTTGGTAQDAQVGYHIMVPRGQTMLVDAINQLKQYAPVETFYSRSNHDELTSFNALGYLYAYFHDDKDVIIDGLDYRQRRDIEKRMRKDFGLVQYEANPRKYIMWGDCLFGFGHGDKEGNRLFSTMPNEADSWFNYIFAKRNNISLSEVMNYDFDEKFAWSKTHTHVFFAGHFHSKICSKDNNGVEVIYCGSEMTGDKWHNDSGYLGAQRRSDIYLYYKNGDVITETYKSTNL